MNLTRCGAAGGGPSAAGWRRAAGQGRRAEGEARHERSAEGGGDWRRRRVRRWRGRSAVAGPDKIIDPCSGGARDQLGSWRPHWSTSRGPRDTLGHTDGILTASYTSFLSIVRPPLLSSAGNQNFSQPSCTLFISLKRTNQSVSYISWRPPSPPASLLLT